MSEIQVGKVLTNGSTGLSSQTDIDAGETRKKWVNKQLSDMINPQNSLPPCGDWYSPKGGDGTAAFYG